MDKKSLLPVGNGACNFFLEEKVVGTWIDGKPLYQKTIAKSGNELEHDWDGVYTGDDHSYNQMRTDVVNGSNGRVVDAFAYSNVWDTNSSSVMYHKHWNLCWCFFDNVRLGRDGQYWSVPMMWISDSAEMVYLNLDSLYSRLATAMYSGENPIDWNDNKVFIVTIQYTKTTD